MLAQQLPTVVESYKTYDDINLVKSSDVGQVRGLFNTHRRPTFQLGRCCSCIHQAPSLQRMWKTKPPMA